MTDPNRIQQVTPATAAENARLAPINVSPTGTPLLPPKITPWAALVVLVAGAALPFTSGMLAVGLQVVIALGAALGIASPGVRHK